MSTCVFKEIFYNSINDDGTQRPDDEDTELLNANLSDLLKVENASEAIKELTFLDATCKINYIMKKLINNWLCENSIKSIDAHVLDDPKCINIKNNDILELQKNIKDKKSFEYITHMVALSLDNEGALSLDNGGALSLDNGAHWAGMVYESKTNQVHLYDSMQIKKTNGSEFSESPFTKFFKKYAKILFQTNNIKVQGSFDSFGTFGTPIIRESDFHRQPTGGVFNVYEKTIKEYNNDEFRELQDFKSQHHFCYMEALLFILEFLVFKSSGFRPKIDIGKNDWEMERNSLMYIKKFIWIIVEKLHLLNPKKPKDFDYVYLADDGEYYYEDWIKKTTEIGSFPTKNAINFYKKVFPYVWDVSEFKMVKVIDTGYNTNNIKDCRDLLNYVYGNL